jgi:adenosylhomocysteine nucleosidase
MRAVLRVAVLIFIVPLVLGLSSRGKYGPGMTAILGAFDEEVAILHDNMIEKESHTFLGIPFTTGKLKGRNVVLVETGVGKVNSAMTVTLLIEHFRPAEVIFSGIAGGINPELSPGDLVIGEKSAQHDLVTVTRDSVQKFAPRNPVNNKRNPIFFQADNRLLNLAGRAAEHIDLEEINTARGMRIPKIIRGIIVTGDAFIASSVKKEQLRRDFQADAVEMEGAAVAQVCYQHRVPCLVIRSLSDNADENADLDLEKFYRIAAQNSAKLVIKMAELLAIQ